MAKIKKAIPCPSCGAEIIRTNFLESKICPQCGDDLSDDKDVLKAFGLDTLDDDDDVFRRMIENSSKYGKNSTEKKQVVTEEKSVVQTAVANFPQKDNNAPSISAPLSASDLQARLRAMTTNQNIAENEDETPEEENYDISIDTTLPENESIEVSDFSIDLSVSEDIDVEQDLKTGFSDEDYFNDSMIDETVVEEDPENIDADIQEKQTDESLSDNKEYNSQRVVQLADGRYLDTVTGELLAEDSIHNNTVDNTMEQTSSRETVENHESTTNEGLNFPNNDSIIDAGNKNIISDVINKVSTEPIKKAKSLADAMRENLEEAYPTVDANSYDMARNEKKENIENFDSNYDHYYDDTQAALPPEPDIIKSSTIRNAILYVVGLFLFSAFMIYYI